ncbi:MAG: Na-translocating system protein MpsC family protein [Solirubrobacteraceae bacterium]
MTASLAPEDALCSLVSDAVSDLYLEKFGRGPLQTSTFIHGDVMVTLLADVFTPAEKALADAGKSDSVLTTRVLWQHSTDNLFRSKVSDITGRGVLSAISGFDLQNDMASEVFVLEPA